VEIKTTQTKNLPLVENRKLNFTIRLQLIQQFVHLHNTKQSHKMLKDHQFIYEKSGFSLELESFENEGIVLDIYFGSGKSLTLELYDELNERFTEHYKIVCQILDPFIIEQLENEIKKCFTK
jgi:hypothetical protein